MKITIDTSAFERVRRSFDGFSERRLDSAIAEGLNRTAASVRDEWGGQLYTRIDRPTAPTRSAAYVKRADVGRLVAEVRLKDKLGSTAGAIAPAEYLSTQEQGSADRRAKKFELALQARGAMPAGYKVVPGRYAKLDGYGNISRGQIVQVLNQLGSNLSVGYQRVIGRSAGKRQRAAARAGRVYVAVPQKEGALAAGIYQREGRNLLPVFFFVARTRYRPRLSLEEHGRAIVQREIGPRIEQAVQARINTLLARGAGA